MKITELKQKIEDHRVLHEHKGATQRALNRKEFLVWKVTQYRNATILWKEGYGDKIVVPNDKAEELALRGWAEKKPKKVTERAVIDKWTLPAVKLQMQQ